MISRSVLAKLVGQLVRVTYTRGDGAILTYTGRAVLLGPKRLKIESDGRSGREYRIPVHSILGISPLIPAGNDRSNGITSNNFHGRGLSRSGGELALEALEAAENGV